MRELRENQIKRVQAKGAMTREPAGEGGLWELCLFAVFFVLVFSAIARADVIDTKSQTANLSAVLKRLEEPKPTFDYTAKVTISTSQPLSEDHPQDFNGAYTLEAGVIHTPTKVALSTKLSFSQEYSYERDDGTVNNWENPVLSISKSFKNDEEFKSSLIDSLKISLGGTLPANREAQRRTFLGSIGPSVSIKKAIGMLEFTQGLGYSRGFYEYDIRDDGTVNAPDSFKSTTGVDLNLTENFALSASLEYTHAISFQGVGKSSQLADLSASYQFTKNVGVALGIGTLRGTLGPDGQSDQVRFYDPDSSEVYLDLSIGI